MTVIDASIAKALDIYLPLGESAAKNRASWEEVYQKRMNKLVDDFVRYVSQQTRFEGVQYRFPDCMIASKVELRALRVNLFQRYQILTGTFPKDHIEKVQEEVKQSYGSPTLTTKEVRHEHSCTKATTTIGTEMEWSAKGEDDAECWQLTLNWFVDDQKRIIGIQDGWGGFVLGSILNEVDAYVEKVAKHDEFVRKYSHFYESWIQERVAEFAKGLVQLLQQAARQTGVQKSMNYEHCIFASESEVNMVCQQIFQAHSCKVIAKRLPEHAHEEDKTLINLTKMFGGLHREQKNQCYLLEFHLDASFFRLGTTPLMIEPAP